LYGTIETVHNKGVTMNYTLSEEILNATLQYLGTRPYTEVASLVEAIRGAQPVAEAEPVSEETA
jgi:hypothetical protein